jgi:L-amino acid N-acyltransferase YncA
MGQILYRRAQESDAERIVDFYNFVGGETSYLSFELYMKFGFIVEGCRKNSTLLNGKYYDLYIMGMML